MLFLFIASLFLICSESFTIDFPYDVKFMAKISNINLLKINEDEKSELQYLFRTTPVLVFENQELTPKEHFEVSTIFDKNFNDKVMHPFKETMVPGVNQVAIRGAGTANHFGVNNVEIRNSNSFKYNELWHQDLVGIKDVLPSVVSSMYMIKTPEKGGATKFASLENSYESLSLLHKSIYEKMEVIYYSKNIFPEIDFTGYCRIDKFWEKESEEEYEKNKVERPLIIYPSEDATKKCFMMTPNRFYKFKEFSCVESHERMRHLMKNHILTDNNIGSLHYKKKDLVIFNNRKIIHTSTPTQQYKEDRIMSLLFLGTNEPLKYL
tara:strand:+ start:1498 stop:2463 length:966 start_codon:yes stop_codon:yes gene_type:complete